MKYKSGVYCIHNIKTGYRYIGSSFNIKGRLRRHFKTLKDNCHHNTFMQRSFNKHGEEFFISYVIEYCEVDLLLEIEQIYMDNVKNTYNITLSSSSPMKGRSHTKEAKLKMKRRVIIRGKDHPNYGRKLTKEHRDAIVKGREGYTHSDLTKSKMRETAILNNNGSRLKGLRSKEIICSKGLVFESITKASIYYQISKQAICDNLKGRSLKTRKGVTFEYL